MGVPQRGPSELCEPADRTARSPGSARKCSLGRAVIAVMVGSLSASAVMLPAAAALAQALPRTLPGAVEPGRERPQPAPPPEGSFDFTIESPRRSPVPRAIDELRFQLVDVTIVGATVFPPETFKPLYEPLIGQQVGLSDILGIADQIEAKYRQAGYLITRAYVPPQRVGNGIFTINVVEGYVSAIAVEGGDPGVHDLVASYLQPVLGARPLDVGTMERALLLANDLPGTQASGLLRPSPDRPGASDLVVTLSQAPFTGGLAVDNRGSRFTGRWTVYGDAEWNSPLGDGDQLGSSVQMMPTDPSERIQGQVRYQHPIGTDGLTGSLAVTVSHGEPVGSLAQLHLKTDSLAVGPRLSYPLLRSRAQSLYLEGGFTVQDAKVFVNALGLTFSHDKWRVVDAAMIYTQNGFWNGTSSAIFDVAEGLPDLGSTPDNSPTASRQGISHTEFTKLTTTLRRVQVIAGPLNVAATIQGQYAFQALVIGEQLSFGGTQLGRGYEPSALSGDYGIGGSLELRYDARFDDSFVEGVQPYAFYDTAKVWDHALPIIGQSAIASTGAGVRVALPHSITGGIEFARTLRAVPGSDDGRHASKILFNAAVRF